MFDCKAHTVLGEADAADTRNSDGELLIDVIRNDETPARAAAEIFINPTHIVEQLSECPVTALRKFKFDHDEFIIPIDRQKVYAATLHGKLNAAVLGGLIQSETGFDALKIFGKKIPKVRFESKF